MVSGNINEFNRGRACVKLTTNVDVLTGISNKWGRCKPLLVGSTQTYVRDERRWPRGFKAKAEEKTWLSAG